MGGPVVVSRSPYLTILVKYVFKLQIKLNSSQSYLLLMNNGLFMFILFIILFFKVQCRLLNSGRTGRTSSISAQKSNPGLHCLPLVRLLVYSKFGDLLFIFIQLY